MISREKSVGETMRWVLCSGTFSPGNISFAINKKIDSCISPISIALSSTCLIAFCLHDTSVLYLKCTDDDALKNLDPTLVYQRIATVIFGLLMGCIEFIGNREKKYQGRIIRKIREGLIGFTTGANWSTHVWNMVKGEHEMCLEHVLSNVALGTAVGLVRGYTARQDSGPIEKHDMLREVYRKETPTCIGSLFKYIGSAGVAVMLSDMITVETTGNNPVGITPVRIASTVAGIIIERFFESYGDNFPNLAQRWNQLLWLLYYAMVCKRGVIDGALLITSSPLERRLNIVEWAIGILCGLNEAHQVIQMRARSVMERHLLPELDDAAIYPASVTSSDLDSETCRCCFGRGT